MPEFDPTDRLRVPRRPALRRWAGLFACAAAGTLGTLSGCSGSAEPEQTTPVAAPAPIGVGVVQAWTSPVERTLRLIGSTRAVNTVAVTAQATGIVQWVGFDDEQQVEEGEPLVRLDERRAAADLRAAEAKLERLDLVLQRTEEAFQRGAGTRTELDDARTLHAEAKAEAERARAVLNDHEIVAPFDGRITRRLVSRGSLVSPGEAIAELNSVDPIEIAFPVPEQFLADLRPGLVVRSTTAAFGNEVFEGSLSSVGAVIDRGSRSAEVYARITNDDGRLRPGMFMNITLQLGTQQRAVLLPESALVVEGNRTEVFVVNAENIAQRRRVTVGARFPGVVEITQGVNAGETVVTSGVQKLREGTPVNPEPDADLRALGIVAGIPLHEQPAVIAAGLFIQPGSAVGDETTGKGSGG